jgi:acylpyruvate hydrolase
LLLFPFTYIISYLSKFFTLRSGDFIFTGTPKGCRACGDWE